MEFTLRICSQCSANSRGDPCADLWSTFHAKFPPFQNSALNFQLPQPPQASSSTSSIQRGPAVFPSLLLCSAKKPGQSEGHLSCFSSPRVHSPVPPVPQSLKTVDSQSSAWKQSVPFSSCLWWEVKFNPYYSQIVQPEWEQCKYHGLICLVSECPSELCERRPDSPALLVCLGVLGLLRAEVHLCLKRCIFHTIWPHSQWIHVVLIWRTKICPRRRKKCPVGLPEIWYVILQWSRLSKDHFYSRRFLHYGLMLGPNLLLRHTPRYLDPLLEVGWTCLFA